MSCFFGLHGDIQGKTQFWTKIHQFNFSWRLQFIESEFRGQLPKQYGPGEDATRIIPTDMNEFNLEETSRYVSTSVDSRINISQGKHFSNLMALWLSKPVFSLGVSQHMNKITNLWKFGPIGHRNCRWKMKEKTPLLRFQMHNKRLQLNSFVIWVRDSLFLKNYFTSEVAVSHNVLYYQPLPIASFYANDCFE